jgi:hypothetical protein
MTMSMKSKAAAVLVFLAALAGITYQVFAPVGLKTIGVAHAAVGDVTSINGGEAKGIELLAATTATNSPPTSNAGLSVNELRKFGMLPDRAVLALASTAGSGTMTVTARLWGKLPMASGIWVPLGPGADATKGQINSVAAIGETGSDTLRHSEVVENLALFERLYLEITAIGGTSTSVTAWLVVRRTL